MAVATNPLKRIPNFMNRPRREILFSSDIVKLLVLGVIRSRIWLPWVVNPFRGQPGNEVGDFLIGDGLARHIFSPIWSSQFRAPCDDNGAQSLVADKRKKRIVGDGTGLLTTATTRAMAGLAVNFVCGFASLGISGRFRQIRRQFDPLEY